MALASVKGTISFGAPFGSIVVAVAGVTLVYIEIAVGPVLLTILGRPSNEGSRRRFQTGKGPRRCLLRDCEIFANLRLKL